MSKKWVQVSAGILSAFEAHNEGSVVGTRVRTVLDGGREIEGVVTEMGRSDVSTVYYDFRIREDGQKRGGLISVPLSHPFEQQQDALEGNSQEQALEAFATKTMSVITEEQRRAKYASLDRITDEPDYCAVCMGEIKVQCFKGTGICSTNCIKEATGEAPVEKALAP